VAISAVTIATPGEESLFVNDSDRRGKDDFIDEDCLKDRSPMRYGD